MTEPVDAPTPDELFIVVSHPVRRWLLKTLPAETSRSIDALAQECVEYPDVAPRTTPRKLALSLQHTHLPRLEQAGLVAVDHDDRAVTLSPTAHAAIRSAAAELDDVLLAIDDGPNTDAQEN